MGRDDPATEDICMDIVSTVSTPRDILAGTASGSSQKETHDKSTEITNVIYMDIETNCLLSFRMVTIFRKVSKNVFLTPIFFFFKATDVKTGHTY